MTYQVYSAEFDLNCFVCVFDFLMRIRGVLNRVLMRKTPRTPTHTHSMKKKNKIRN